ncbi:MAG: flippase [Candidatus Andersenbacteria bacterium]|nr:flippase [Candidatus Andersenbacteria bacterium]
MKQSRLTGAISLSLAQAVVLLLGYATHFWIPRVLGAASYGIFGIILSVQTIFGLLITLGVPAAVSRFVAQHEDSAQSILRKSLRLQTLIAVIVASISLALSPLISYLLGDRSLLPYLAFVTLIILCQAFYPIYVQFLSGMHRFHRQATLTSLYAIAKLVGAIGLIYVFHLYGALAGFALGGIMAGVIGWWWTRGVGGSKPYNVPAKDLLSFASLYVLTLAGLQILMSLDLFMVKALLKDDTAVGYYNAASTLARIPYFLLQGLSFILLPSVSALTKPGQDHAKAAQFIRDTLRYLIALIVPSVALAAATSRELVTLFFSAKFLPAAPTLTILMVGLGALAFYLLLANIAAGAGKAKVAFLITILMIAISFCTGIYTIRTYGLPGAAWQTTISAIIGFIILAWYTFRTFKIPVPSRSMVNILIASAIAVTPTYFWKAGSLMLPIQYLVLYAVYVVCLYVLGEITTSDRRLVGGLHPALRWIIPTKL